MRRWKHAGRTDEEFRRTLCQSSRTSVAGAKPHQALAAVLQVNLAVRRVKPMRQRLLSAALCFQRAEYELDVLAGAEVVGGEIGAGTEVLPRLRPADRHPVAASALWIGHLKLGKHRPPANVLQLERLRTTELA